MNSKPLDVRGMNNPYSKGDVTRMKLVLPVSKKEAWRLIATARGLASWCPSKCRGRLLRGQTLEFEWPDGSVETHRVVRVGDGNSSLALDWWHGGRVQFYLHGRQPTHLTLRVEYPRSAKRWRSTELVGWTFFLSNLKSVAMKGPDLRSKNPKLSWKRGYID